MLTITFEWVNIFVDNLKHLKVLQNNLKKQDAYIAGTGPSARKIFTIF